MFYIDNGAFLSEYCSRQAVDIVVERHNDAAMLEESPAQAKESIGIRDMVECLEKDDAIKGFFFK